MGNLGKLIVSIGFEKLPKVQLIVQSGHTVNDTNIANGINVEKKLYDMRRGHTKISPH